MQAWKDARWAKYSAYPLGYFHIDMTEVRTERDKLSIFVAIDRTSRAAQNSRRHPSMRRISRPFRGAKSRSEALGK
jgi:hypothetical protein